MYEVPSHRTLPEYENLFREINAFGVPDAPQAQLLKDSRIAHCVEAMGRVESRSIAASMHLEIASREYVQLEDKKMHLSESDRLWTPISDDWLENPTANSVKIGSTIASAFLPLQRRLFTDKKLGTKEAMQENVQKLRTIGQITLKGRFDLDVTYGKDAYFTEKIDFCGTMAELTVLLLLQHYFEKTDQSGTMMAAPALLKQDVNTTRQDGKSTSWDTSIFMHNRPAKPQLVQKLQVKSSSSDTLSGHRTAYVDTIAVVNIMRDLLATPTEKRNGHTSVPAVLADVIRASDPENLDRNAMYRTEARTEIVLDILDSAA